MFLKKLLKSDTSVSTSQAGPPAGVQTMGVSLQNKFAKGINYNSEFFAWQMRDVGS